MSATRRLNVCSRFSPSSSGFGSSTSVTRRARPLPDLFSHRVLGRLERRHHALRLLLEQLAALVDPLAGVVLGVTGPVLGSPGGLAAPAGQQLKRLAAGTRCRQQRGGRAEHGAEEEPTEIATGVALIVAHDGLLVVCGGGKKIRRAPS